MLGLASPIAALCTGPPRACEDGWLSTGLFTLPGALATVDGVEGDCQSKRQKRDFQVRGFGVTSDGEGDIRGRMARCQIRADGRSHRGDLRLNPDQHAPLPG